MTSAKSSIRTAIGTAVVLLATSMATAYGADTFNLNQAINAKQSSLPGVVAQTDPCGPKNTVGKLGY
jgi:hypothetical protein